MANITNLQYSNKSEKTTNYFNNFYDSFSSLEPHRYESIISFFQKQTGSIESAKLLTQAVVDTAKDQRVDPLELLEEFKLSNADEFSYILSLYLNSSRVNTSLLGVKSDKKPNFYVARNIMF